MAVLGEIEIETGGGGELAELPPPQPAAASHRIVNRPATNVILANFMATSLVSISKVTPRWSVFVLIVSHCVRLPSVVPIPCAVWASSPKARAGCGNSARPDPWRGLCANMIPTPTLVFLYCVLYCLKTSSLERSWHI